MDLDELFAVCDLLVFVQERVLWFPEFLFEYKFIGHENLTGDDYVQEIELPVVELRMLVYISI